MQKKSKLWQLVAFGLAILPAALTGILIIKYNVSVSFLDRWEVAKYIIKLYSHQHISLSELFAQHNESRIFFPKLIFIGLAYLTHWDVRYEMLVTYVVACLISFNIYWLIRFSVSVSLFKQIVILLISNILIFSPIQHDNWLWGIQLIVFVPIACITTSIAIAYSELGIKSKLLLCIVLATISTFSYANGLLCWVVVLPALAVINWQDFQHKKWLFLAWIAGFTANLMLYFYGYEKPAHHPSFAEALFDPIAAVNFFLAFLGSPLGFKNLIVSTLVGGGLFGTFIAGCVYLLKFRKNYLLRYRLIGWLAIGFYAIISAFVTTLGRLGFGVNEALTSKYTTFSLYLAVAIILMVVIIVEDAARKGYSLANNQRFLHKFGVILSIIFLFLYAFVWDNALGRMNSWKRERLQGKACLLFINIVAEEECLKEKIYPSFTKLKQIANELNSLGLIQPGLVMSSRIKDIHSGNNIDENDRYGWFDRVTKANQYNYVATGWARWPDRGEPADAVVLTYENSEGEAIVFAVADDRTKRKDIAKATKIKAYSMSGWQKYFQASKLPKGWVKINAWAYDTNSGKAFKIGGTVMLENN